MSRSPAAALAALAGEIEACRACPRLVAFREHVARTKRAAYRNEPYWGRPVSGFGDARAKLVILGLAPGAHGANRTGRVFTGDRSGDFLYAALHRAGLASQPTSKRRDDGLALSGVYITLAARCVPPENRPLPEETKRCGAWLDRELALLRPRVVLALGAIAWNAYLDHASRSGAWSAVWRRGAEGPRPHRTTPAVLLRPRPRFAHGARTALPGGLPVLLGSYHVSQQNTQTGRLTPAMFDHVLRQAVTIVAGIPSP